MKKGFISIFTIALASSLLISNTAQAEDKSNYEMTKKLINHQLEKPIKKGTTDSRKLNQYRPDLKATGSIARMSKSNDDLLFEEEPNDDFNTANSIVNEITMIGQLSMYDIDKFKVRVPSKGSLIVAGTSTSYNIDLEFGLSEKDYSDNGNLEFKDYEYNNGVELQFYQVNKAGTYYITALDEDNTYHLDDNQEDDFYGIRTTFVDDVKPAKPSINKIYDNDKAVTGKAEAGSTVTVKSGSKVLGTAKAGSNKKYTVKIKAQKKGTILSVTAKDKAGNVSSKATAKVVKH